MREFSEQRLRQLRGLALKLFAAYMADRLGVGVGTIEAAMRKGKYGDLDRLGGEWYLFAEAIQAEQGVAMSTATGAQQRIEDFCAGLNDLIQNLAESGRKVAPPAPGLVQ